MSVELIEATELHIPMSQLLLYIGSTTLATLFRRRRLNLIISYVFVFYWGFLQNAVVIRDALHGSLSAILIYFAFGVILLILAVFSFFKD